MMEEFSEFAKTFDLESAFLGFILGVGVATAFWGFLVRKIGG